jgi:hypothetical protein
MPGACANVPAPPLLPWKIAFSTKGLREAAKRHIFPAVGGRKAVISFVHKAEILRLRDEFRRWQGKGYRIRSIQDQLLSLGTVPFTLVEEPILEQKL